MNQPLEDLGLAPNLSRLPGEVHELIQHGCLRGHPDARNVGAAVCAALFRAGYGVDEVWMVMTDPANGISEKFFEEDGEQAEAHLELIISETYDATTVREW